MTVISIPASTRIRPTRVESFALSGVVAVGAFIARRIARRAARLNTREAQDAVAERRRDSAAAHALGLYPG